jgi:hypothetical protein
VTCILYLNKDWRSGDGGELRIYHPPSSFSGSSDTTIPPLLNRLVVFWSDMWCLHEVPSLPLLSLSFVSDALTSCQVLPSNKTRYAITLWFIDSKERDRRVLLDQEEERQRTLPSSEAMSVVSDSLTLLSDDYSLTDASHTFQIQFPPSDPDAFRNSELLVSEAEIKITPVTKTAGASEISAFHLQLSREIFPNQTVAKFSKKTSILALTVHFKDSVGEPHSILPTDR